MWPMLRRLGALQARSVPEYPSLPGGRFPTEPLKLPGEVKDALSDARELMRCFRQLLAALQQRGLEDSTEYRQVLQLAEDLAHTMERARSRAVPPDSA